MKHTILTIVIAFILGAALTPVKDSILTKFNYSPAAVVTVHVGALLIIGVPVLLLLNKKKPVGGGERWECLIE
jgi:predicted PurR-regulated permease PerM